MSFPVTVPRTIIPSIRRRGIPLAASVLGLIALAIVVIGYAAIPHAAAIASTLSHPAIEFAGVHRILRATTTTTRAITTTTTTTTKSKAAITTPPATTAVSGTLTTTTTGVPVALPTAPLASFNRALLTTFDSAGTLNQQMKNNPLTTVLRPQPFPTTPLKYFAFASDLNGFGITQATVDSLITTYDSNILIGVDGGDQNGFAMYQHVMAQNLYAHIYLEGPGGPTGSTGWSPDEWQRASQSAATVGITLPSSSPPASQTVPTGTLLQWSTVGWKTFTRNQIMIYNDFLGFSTYEIDNIDLSYDSSGNAVDDTDAAYLSFLQEQQAWLDTYKITSRLVMKNVGEGALGLVHDAIAAGTLRRNILADFMISEDGSWDNSLADQVASAAAIGVQCLYSADTYNYGVSGAYAVA